jgi:hypothetical protein
LTFAFFWAGAALIPFAAVEGAAPEIVLLRGLEVGGGMAAAAFAAPAFDLEGGPVFFDFINDCSQKPCHESQTTIADHSPARNQKFPSLPPSPA